MKKPSLGSLLRRVHQNEEGTVSLETILIVGAIALPILIFLLYKAWPVVREYFKKGLEDLQTDPNTAAGSM